MVVVEEGALPVAQPCSPAQSGEEEEAKSPTDESAWSRPSRSTWELRLLFLSLVLSFFLPSFSLSVRLPFRLSAPLSSVV